MRVTSTLSLALTASTLVQGFPTLLSFPRTNKPRELTTDDIIVVKDGAVTVMAKADYLAANADLMPPANVTAPLTNTITSGNATAARLAKRCDSYSITTMNPVQTFLNWDVPMSSVIHADTTTAQVAVTQGYSISNSISVSISATLSTVSQVLGVSLGIDYSKSWTSSYETSYTFTVPEGHYGAVVSNPKTTRYSGVVDVGCAGVGGEQSTWQSDIYTDKSYGNLAWVDGTISLCTGTEYPLPNCIGDG
ncbi:hypothetical protein BGZ60DRAFT_445444, partial [Tricladium varicosporioides]